MHLKKIFISNNPRKTVQYGKAIARHAKRGDCVFLYGDLGAGKTVMTKGIARGLGVKETVTSPTFTIVNEYAGRIPMYHIDLYRIRNSEVSSLGLEEYLFADGLSVVEWADKLSEKQSHNIINIYIKNTGGKKRIIYVKTKKKHRK